MFGARRAFADQFRCHSVSLLAAEQQRDPARLEYADKIILPPSCLERLAHLEITYPMIFELTNPRYLQRRLHCEETRARARDARARRAARPPPTIHASLAPRLPGFFLGGARAASAREVTVAP